VTRPTRAQETQRQASKRNTLEILRATAKQPTAKPQLQKCLIANPRANAVDGSDQRPQRSPAAAAPPSIGSFNSGRLGSGLSSFLSSGQISTGERGSSVRPVGTGPQSQTSCRNRQVSKVVSQLDRRHHTLSSISMINHLQCEKDPGNERLTSAACFRESKALVLSSRLVLGSFFLSSRILFPVLFSSIPTFRVTETEPPDGMRVWVRLPLLLGTG
jgi:hypothetical protein